MYGQTLRVLQQALDLPAICLCDWPKILGEDYQASFNATTIFVVITTINYQYCHYKKGNYSQAP